MYRVVGPHGSGEYAAVGDGPVEVTQAGRRGLFFGDCVRPGDPLSFRLRPHDHFTVERMCLLVEVSRSSFLRVAGRPEALGETRVSPGGLHLSATSGMIAGYELVGLPLRVVDSSQEVRNEEIGRACDR